MVSHGAINPLCDLLMQQEDWIVALALEGLEKILRVRRRAWGSHEGAGACVPSCVPHGIRRIKMYCRV